MSLMKRAVALAMGFLFALAISGCAPEVGSERWCETMKEKPKGDWTANEAADFAKSCIL